MESQIDMTAEKKHTGRRIARMVTAGAIARGVATLTSPGPSHAYAAPARDPSEPETSCK